MRCSTLAFHIWALCISFTGAFQLYRPTYLLTSIQHQNDELPFRRRISDDYYCHKRRNNAEVYLYRKRGLFLQMSSEEDGDIGEISDVAAVTDVNGSKVNGDDSKKEDEKAYKRSSLILEKFKNIRSKEQKLRYKSLSLAKSMVVEPVKGVVGRGASQVRPDAIAGILLDAAEGSAEEVGKVMQKTQPVSTFGTQDRLLQEIEDASTAEDQINAIEETALSMILETKTVTEAAIAATQTSAEASIARLKANSVSTILSIEVTANEAIASIADEAKKAGVDVSSTSASATLSIGQESAMSMAPNDGNIATERRPLQRVFTDDEIETLSLQDIDFSLSDMAPPYIDEDSCLIPGEAIVRVEKAPENSRRIFAGIDIMASVDEVWNVRLILSWYN